MKAGTNLWIWLVTQFQKDQTEGLHKGEEGVRREGAGPSAGLTCWGWVVKAWGAKSLSKAPGQDSKY